MRDGGKQQNHWLVRNTWMNKAISHDVKLICMRTVRHQVMIILLDQANHMIYTSMTMANPAGSPGKMAVKMEYLSVWVLIYDF